MDPPNSTVKRQPEARSSSTVEKPFGGSSRSSRSEFTSSGNGINLPYMSYVMLGGRMHWRGHVILVRLTTFGGSNTREMVYDVCLCVTPVYPSIHSILMYLMASIPIGSEYPVFVRLVIRKPSSSNNGIQQPAPPDLVWHYQSHISAVHYTIS